jgi:hypothetical protein
MNGRCESKVRELKEQIRCGEYRVDSIAVADAIMQILRDAGVGPEPVAAYLTSVTGRRRSRFGAGLGGGRPEDRTPVLAS